MVISVPLVHSGSPWVLLDSCGGAKGEVGLIRAFHGGSRVHSGSSGSFAFACFIRARSGVRLVHSCFFGSFMRASVVVVFIEVRLVHSGAPWGSVTQ